MAELVYTANTLTVMNQKWSSVGSYLQVANS